MIRATCTSAIRRVVGLFSVFGAAKNAVSRIHRTFFATCRLHRTVRLMSRIDLVRGC